MKYRRATAQDASDIVAIHYKAVQAIPDTVYSPDIKNAWSPAPAAERIERIADTLGNPDFLCLVATTNSVIAGFTILSVPRRFLQAIYVDPDTKGLGIGAALLSATEQEAATQGVDTIELKASLNAAPFYLKTGYSKVCDSTQQLAEGIEMRSITMRKEIARRTIASLQLE